MRPVPHPAMSSPLKIILPSVGVLSCRIERPVVDFPQPDSPTSPSVSPRRMKKLTSSTAFTSPTLRENSSPDVIGKYCFRFWTSTM